MSIKYVHVEINCIRFFCEVQIRKLHWKNLIKYHNVKLLLYHELILKKPQNVANISAYS